LNVIGEKQGLQGEFLYPPSNPHAHGDLQQSIGNAMQSFAIGDECRVANNCRLSLALFMHVNW